MTEGDKLYREENDSKGSSKTQSAKKGAKSGEWQICWEFIFPTMQMLPILAPSLAGWGWFSLSLFDSSR